MKMLVAAAVVTIAGGASAAQPDTPSFCARLAPQIGLQRSNNTATYQGRLISGLKAAFIGGTASIAFGVEAVDSTPVEDEAALRRACTMTKGEYRCVVDRPMILTVSSSKGDGRVEAQPGERALVTTKGVTVRCTDGVIA